MTELEHPRWCDPAHCTATVARPEYRVGETGYHRSAPVTVEHVPSAGDVVFDRELNPLVVHLSQPAPPWDPVTLLNIGTMVDPEFLSLPVTSARAVLLRLGALVEFAVDDRPSSGGTA